MTLVVDASFVGAWLVDGGSDGSWAAELLENQHVAAPHLMPVEVASILRKAANAGDISDDTATLALQDLSDLHVDLYAFDPFSDRVWELRHNVTTYDAWHIAVAESLGAPLGTLDVKLSNASGPTCSFNTPIAS